MDLELKGKKALVMGASDGIGKSIAQVLIQEGVQVAICSRSEAKLAETAKQIGAAKFFACDLSKKGEAARVTLKTQQELGGLDILVTNTGGPAKGSILDITAEQWENDFQSLWMSVVESVKVAIPEMKKNNFGRILLVTSLAAKEPLPGLTTSNGLRAGLSGLTKSISTEMAGFGITINALLPGYTNTDRLKELKLSEERVKQMVPVGRLASPEELGYFAAFLSSPKAGYFTGHSFTLDGGALKGF